MEPGGRAPIPARAPSRCAGDSSRGRRHPAETGAGQRHGEGRAIVSSRETAFKTRNLRGDPMGAGLCVHRPLLRPLDLRRGARRGAVAARGDGPADRLLTRFPDPDPDWPTGWRAVVLVTHEAAATDIAGPTPSPRAQLLRRMPDAQRDGARALRSGVGPLPQRPAETRCAPRRRGDAETDPRREAAARAAGERGAGAAGRQADAAGLGYEDFGFRPRACLPRMRTTFRDHEVVELPRAKHYIQENAPEEIAGANRATLRLTDGVNGAASAAGVPPLRWTGLG